MIKVLCHKLFYGFLVALFGIQLLQLIFGKLIRIDSLSWYTSYADIINIITGVCTVGALILTIDIYKESKEISKSVDKVIKAKNFELTKYTEFMDNVKTCIEILKKYLLNNEDKGTSSYIDAAYDFRDKLNSINVILKNYPEELSSGLDKSAKDQLNIVNEFLNSYLENLKHSFVDSDKNNELFDRLCTLKALSKSSEHAK